MRLKIDGRDAQCRSGFMPGSDASTEPLNGFLVELTTVVNGTLRVEPRRRFGGHDLGLNICALGPIIGIFRKVNEVVVEAFQWNWENRFILS